MNGITKVRRRIMGVMVVTLGMIVALNLSCGVALADEATVINDAPVTIGAEMTAATHNDVLSAMDADDRSTVTPVCYGADDEDTPDHLKTNCAPAVAGDPVTGDAGDSKTSESRDHSQGDGDATTSGGLVVEQSRVPVMIEESRVDTTSRSHDVIDHSGDHHSIVVWSVVGVTALVVVIGVIVWLVKINKTK